MDVVSVLVTLALVEYIYVPITTILVKLFFGETPPESVSVHSMKPAIRWVMHVRSIVVIVVAITSPPAASSSAFATPSLRVEFGYPAIILALAVPWFASTATLVPWAAPVARVHPRTALSMQNAC